MSTFKTSKYCLYLLLTLGINTNYSLVFADDFAQKKILELQDQITDDNTKLSKLDQEIKKIDTQISEKANRISKLDALINKIATTKLELQNKKTEQFAILNLQKKQLLKQLEGTYILHRNNNFQKFAKIENLQQLNRLLNYIDSFNKNSTNKIADIKQSIAQIEQLDQNLDLLNREHHQFKEKFSAEYASLQKFKNNNSQYKQELIASLSKNKSSLKFYKSAQERIANNLTTSKNPANRLAKRDSERVDPNSPFGRAKGSLSLPVDGIIDNTFKNSDDSRQALFIKTPEGQKVKAVFDGKIVFSNWLRGYGFLTIVNHGNGYMSLYGHNQTLFKKPGDRIKAGDTVALSGASGNTVQPGVYFEIRHNGNTMNPLAWLNTDSKAVG